jgi:tetratricopeptide (TPR) repeat protein
VLEADLSPLHRAVLNASVAQALESLGSPGAEPVPAGRLAAHFVAAGDRFRPKAERYARLAATDATRRFGHTEACRYLELALRLLGDDPSSVAERLGLLLELGAARRRAGDLQKARDVYRQVARLARHAHPLALARATLGLTSLEVRSGTPIDENIGLLRLAINGLEEPAFSEPGDTMTATARSASLSRLYAALARELVHSNPKADEQERSTAAQAAADRAIQLAIQADDPMANANALLARHDASWRPGTATQRLPLIAELITAAEAADDSDLAAEGILLRGAALIELGNPEGIRQLQRFIDLSEHLGHARGRWAALTRRATLNVITGDLDRAAELTAEALDLGTKIGIPDALGCYGTISISFAILGHPIELAMPPEGDPVDFVFPIMKALSMPAADHRPAVRNVPLSALESGHDLDLERQVVAGAAFARFGTNYQRRAVYQMLAAHAGDHVVIGGCASYYGPVDHYLGLLAAALGDSSHATEHFQAAIEAARRLGATPWEDLSRDALATLGKTNSMACFKRDGSTWRLAYQGVEVHLPNAKGLQDLATLLAVPGREIHVYTLLGRDVPATGADPVLDDEAKRQYRRRAKHLRETIEQADRDGDASASGAASKELEVLSRELSAAAGLHGRDRRLDDEVERARKTVSARIHDALSRIAFAHPALGSHFSSAIVLGVRCSYQPSEPIQWQVGSV